MTDKLPFDFTYFRGRVALLAILRALGIGPGDRVAIQAFTCVAVPEAIFAAGATPIYVDVERGRFNMCPDDLRRKIAGVKAIVLQHTFGIPAAMDRLLDVAGTIPVIEDCCHTYDSQFAGQTVGTFGIGSFYSFEWGKPVVAGIGGGAIARSESLRTSLSEAYKDLPACDLVQDLKISLQFSGFRLLYHPRVYWYVRDIFRLLSRSRLFIGNYTGRSNSPGTRSHAEVFGTLENMRMSRFAESRLRVAWLKRAAFRNNSERLAAIYRQARSPLIEHPVADLSSMTVFARYPLLTSDKQHMLRKARNAYVEIASWYDTPIHPLSGADLAAIGYEEGSCPNAERLCEQVVSLPTNLRVTMAEAKRTVEFLEAL